jgi:outer membrane lipoprotein-sorting protein
MSAVFCQAMGNEGGHLPALLKYDSSMRKHTWKRSCLISGLLPGLFAVSMTAQTSASSTPGSSASARPCFLPGLSPNATGGVEDGNLLSAYNARASLVRSLEAAVVVRGKGGTEYGPRAKDSRPSPAMIDFRAPASLRVTGEIPFSGRRSFDISSDGREFRLLVPDGKVMRFFVGPVDAAATSAKPLENLRPQPLIDALRWTPGQLGRSPELSQDENEGTRTISVDLPASQGGAAKTVRLEFDLRSGVVAELAVLDASQRVVSEIHYSDWQEIAQSGKGADPVCFPRRIVLIQPRQDLQLEIKILSLELNSPIPSSQFRVAAPRGIPVTRLSLSGAGNDR